jgi:hypothetical protein
MGERFRLVFAGDVIDGHRIDQVQRELAELLHLNEARQQSLFSGKRTVLRRGLGFEAATRHALKFERLGAKVLIEPEPESESPAKAPPKVRRKPRSPHRKVWLASSSVVVMAALAGTGWFLWGWDSPAAPQVSDERLAAYQLSPKAREVLLTEYWPAGWQQGVCRLHGRGVGPRERCCVRPRRNPACAGRLRKPPCARHRGVPAHQHHGPVGASGPPDQPASNGAR